MEFTVIAITHDELRALMPLLGARSRPHFRSIWRVLPYNERLYYVQRVRSSLAVTVAVAS